MLCQNVQVNPHLSVISRESHRHNILGVVLEPKETNFLLTVIFKRIKSISMNHSQKLNVTALLYFMYRRNSAFYKVRQQHLSTFILQDALIVLDRSNSSDTNPVYGRSWSIYYFLKPESNRALVSDSIYRCQLINNVVTVPVLF